MLEKRPAILYQRSLSIVISWGSLIRFGMLLGAQALLVCLSKELLRDITSCRRCGLLIVAGSLLLQAIVATLVRATGLDQHAMINGWSWLSTLGLALLTGGVRWSAIRLDAAAALARSSGELL